VWAQESLIGLGHIGDTWRTQLNDSDAFGATMQPCVKLLCPLVIIIVTASINIHDQNRSKWTGGVDFALSLSPRRRLCRAAVQFFPPSTKRAGHPLDGRSVAAIGPEVVLRHARACVVSYDSVLLNEGVIQFRRRARWMRR